MSLWKRWSRYLRPPFAAREARRVGGHLVRRLRPPGDRVITLPAREGPPRGHALVSYLVAPFLHPDRPLPHSHTNYWEARQIALTWADLGYEVDVIDWTNAAFRPSKPYDVLVDPRVNLERLAPLVGSGCLKIHHQETAHHAFHNAAQHRRLAELEARRGITLGPRRLIEPNLAVEHADFGTTTGNEFTIGTYAAAGRTIYRIPISTPLLFPSPADKDFASCARRFLWFGSGGLVHKGLDLVLDAFAGLPEYELVVCGPTHVERDFEAAFQRELFHTPNIRLEGWVDIATERFRRIAASCLGVVYVSCSEGGGGSAVTCMHAGLIPVVTTEVSVDLGDFGVPLADASVETIREAVRATAALPASRQREMALAAWSHARAHHTRERFAEVYRQRAEEMLQRHAERPRPSEGPRPPEGRA